MKTLLALCVALFLSACNTTPIIDGDSTQARAGNAIAQAEVALTKGYRLVTDQANAGVLLKSEVEAALAALDKAAKAVDDAKALYDRGVFDGALDKVLDADTALDLIEAEIEKKLRERRKPVSVSSADADQACKGAIFEMLVVYHDLKAAQVSEDEIIALLGGPADMVEATVRFIRADFAGDNVAAGQALTALYLACMAHLSEVKA